MEKSKLKRKLFVAIIALLVALASVSTATFAWYVYNTNAHTTRVHMAAGTGVHLLISNERDGEYAASTTFKQEFNSLLNPVSTDKIANGFQKVLEYQAGGAGQPSFLAVLFGTATESVDYYATTLWLKAVGNDMDVYLSEIGFTDDYQTSTIATALRVGLQIGEGATKAEYTFEVSKEENPNRQYNTYNGHPGCVLDSTKTDGSVVEFTALDESALCSYDRATGDVQLKYDGGTLTSQKLLSLTEDMDPVPVKVYIWLEGCDEDCTASLSAMTLKNLSLAFAGVAKEG